MSETKFYNYRFAPLQQEVKVLDSPITGIIFSQLRATVRGKINCIGGKSCQDFIINLVSKTGHDHMSAPINKGMYQINDFKVVVFTNTFVQVGKNTH